MRRSFHIHAGMRHVARRSAATLAAAMVALVAALALAGCAGSPPTRYHAVMAVGAPAKVAYDGLPIEVGAVRIPPALARQELVRETGSGPLEVREFDHWAAPLGRLARQALAEDFAARLPAGKIVFPGAAWPVAGAVLTVDILSFAVRDGGATMVLSWNVQATLAAGAASQAVPPAPRGEQLQLDAPAGEGASATALAWSQLLAQLADRVAAELTRSPVR